jgi:hypothetical protein
MDGAAMSVDDDRFLHARATRYIESLLWAHRTSRRIPKNQAPDDGPEYPAVMAYDTHSDQMWWLECGSWTLLRDIMRLNPDTKLSVAAKELVALPKSPGPWPLDIIGIDRR